MNTVKDDTKNLDVSEQRVRRALAQMLPGLVKTVTEQVVSERVARAINAVRGRVD
jgi:hypothetical protein